eukprot:scaffold4824_cov145-Isochrysis_galbana.AAC.3
MRQGHGDALSSEKRPACQVGPNRIIQQQVARVATDVQADVPPAGRVLVPIIVAEVPRAAVAPNAHLR